MYAVWPAQFGMVEFSGEAVSPPGNADNGDCYGTQLAMATPKNVKYITDTYLKNIRPTGATNYGNALKKGFAFFSDTPDVKNDKRSRGNLREHCSLLVYE